jgi:acyl-CoA synthetase (AMP-forming)/AMP-acid ligase II
VIRAGVALREALIAAKRRVLLHDMVGGTRTASELLDRVERLAGALIEKGLAGAKIGLWYRNNCAAVEAHLAVEWIGGTRVPIDPHAPAAEADAVFTSAGVGAVLVDHAHRMTNHPQALEHDNERPLAGMAVWPNVQVDANKPLLIYPRAVENGRLFGIPVSYENWRETMRINIDLFHSGRYGAWQGKSECFLAAQQIMHGTGFIGTFPFLEMGLPQVLIDAFDAERVLDTIDRFGVTTTVLVPPMLARLVDAAMRRPGAGRTLKHLLYGGAPVAANEIRRTMSRFGAILTQAYGRIEGGWPITVLGIEEHMRIFDGDNELAASCGRPIPSVKVKLRPIPKADADCGELCVAGKTTVAGYTGPDGWCSLGDIMRQDQAGYFYYRGRLDRMINTGYHVYPAEIEEAIGKVPGVKAARVTGEADEKWGTTLVADLALEQGAPSEKVIANVEEALSQRLAKYKIPRRYRIVESLSN